MTRAPLFLLLALPIALAGCSDNSQTALIPAGLEADRIASFSWILFAFGAAVFLIVVAAMLAAIVGPANSRRVLATRRAILVLGLAFPVVTLLALLIFSTFHSSGLLAIPDDPRRLVVKVTGEQWWWRVAYATGDGQTIESANEIHIPVGQPVVFELNAADVIHSFWVPSLGGKIDMIPGRTNRLRLTAERAGVYRGQCAEYCGGPHALMALSVVAAQPDEYAAWLDRQKLPPAAPSGQDERDGAALFAAAGCNACHTIDGTPAKGTIGPNLSHIGSRRSIGIEQNLMSHANIVRFLADGQTIKPHNRMPEFKLLSARERDAIASYLLSLR
jgi:cytochrome c oxidase subunit 2